MTYAIVPQSIWQLPIYQKDKSYFEMQLSQDSFADNEQALPLYYKQITFTWI